MKTPFYRLLLAGIAALVLHGVFLFWSVAPAGKTLPEPVAMQKIMVSLHDRKPVTQKVLAVPESQPEIKQKKVVISEKKKVHSIPPKPRPAITSEPQPPLESPVEEKTVSVSPAPVSIDLPVSSNDVLERVKSEQQGQTERIAHVIQQATPLYQVNPPPGYPRLARRRGLQGIVLLTVLVDVAGHVQELEVARSSGHKILDQAALKAVRHWLFRPGTIGGKARKMWVNVPVRFRLQ